MKKKILSVMLTLALCLGMMQVTAFATGESVNIWVAGQQMTVGGSISSGGGTATLTKDGDNYILTLDNFNYEGNGYCESYLFGNIYYGIYSEKPLTIKLKGTNIINTLNENDDDDNGYGIGAPYGLTIDSGNVGDSLTVTGNGASNNAGISVDGTALTIYGDGTVTACGAPGEREKADNISTGIHALRGVNISGNGTVEAIGGDAKISSGIKIDEMEQYELNISGNVTVTATAGKTQHNEYSNQSCGISAPNVNITGGTVTATGGTATDNGESMGIYLSSAHMHNTTNCILNIQNSIVTATGGTVTGNGNSAGIYQWNRDYHDYTDCIVNIQNSIVTATGGDYGIQQTSEEGNCKLNISNSTLTAEGNIKATDSDIFTGEEQWYQWRDVAGGEFNNVQLNYTGNPYLHIRPIQSNSVTFDSNGGDGVMETQKINVGATAVLTANTFTRSGHIFYSWKDESVNDYKDGQSITPTQDMTLKAQWVELPAVKTGLEYTGEAQQLIDADEDSRVNVAYILTGDQGISPAENDSRWSAEKPEATDAGAYYVWYKVTDKSDYMASTYIGCAAAEISKSDPTYTVPTSLTATYGDTLDDVVLPAGWSWKDAADTKVGNVGNNTFTAVFTPEDTANYKVVEIDVAIKVNAVPTPPATSEPPIAPTPTPNPPIAPTPTPNPTVEPTPNPTVEPTPNPTVEPTPNPTVEPTTEPPAPPTPSAEPQEEVVMKDEDGMLSFSGVLAQTADELTEILISEEDKALLEKGIDIIIFLENTDISTYVTEEEKQLVAEAVNSVENAQVGVYLDINLFKQIGNSDPEKITNTDAPIVISVEIPQHLISTDENVQRTYYIVRVHNGQTDIIEGEFDPATGIFTFETDKFSTYTIIYTDVVTEAPAPQQESFPWWIVVAAVVVVVVVLAVVVVVVKKKHSEE